jgi:peptidyl-prolyl cis-trans isomerase C
MRTIEHRHRHRDVFSDTYARDVRSSKRCAPIQYRPAGTDSSLGDHTPSAFQSGSGLRRTACIKEDFLVSISPVLRPASRIGTQAVAAIIFAALLATPVSSSAETSNPDPIVAVVNGIELHEADISMADVEIGRNLPMMDQAERRQQVISMLIDTVILSEEATRQKIGDQADLQRRMTYARNQGLMNQLLAVTAQRAATDEAVRKTYDDVVEKSPEVEVRLRQIVFRVADPKDAAAIKAIEEKAKTAFQRIANGEDFAKVAADASEDTLAKSNGGDIGWRGINELGKEYADAVAKLKTGEATPLVKTAFGLHIVKLEDRRTRKPPEFDQMRGRVKEMVMRKSQIELVERLRAEAKIERKDQPAQATVKKSEN